MTRSIDAGSWRPAWIAAFLVIVLSAPAHAADWQPITGSQTQTTPRPATQPSGSGSGGYGGIPTWGRGGGWSGEPDHPHPPVTAFPRRRRRRAAACTSTHRTAIAGDYATVIATFSDAALRDLGRMDLLIDGRPAAGATRQGNGFTYAFRVPAGAAAGRRQPDRLCQPVPTQLRADPHPLLGRRQPDGDGADGSTHRGRWRCPDRSSRRRPAWSEVRPPFTVSLWTPTVRTSAEQRQRVHLFQQLRRHRDPAPSRSR